MSLVPCQVCGNFTLSNHGLYEICYVCFWEDDGLYTNPDEVWGGPNGNLSLTQARKNFIEFGAVDKKHIKDVTPVQPMHRPRHNLSYIPKSEIN